MVCEIHFWSRRAPKFRIDVTFSRVVELIENDESIILRFMVILNDLHFEALSFSFQSAAQHVTASRSC